ncbi:MAG: hypothetical protein K6F77_01410 [Lachnospiraceae bacterium]|nr:hypothetical protein [Lachnospiraceae bacterium]
MSECIRSYNREMKIRFSNHKGFLIANIMFGIIVFFSGNIGWAIVSLLLPFDVTLCFTDFERILPLSDKEIKQKLITMVSIKCVKYSLLRICGRLFIIGLDKLGKKLPWYDLTMINEHTLFMVIIFIFSIIMYFDLGLSIIVEKNKIVKGQKKNNEKILHIIIRYLSNLAFTMFFMYELSISIPLVIKIGNYDSPIHIVILCVCIVISIANIVINIQKWKIRDTQFVYIM